MPLVYEVLTTLHSHVHEVLNTWVVYEVLSTDS